MLSASRTYFCDSSRWIEPSRPPQKEIVVRPATPVDLDIITIIGLAALPLDPIWPYRFPFAQTYPEDHFNYSRLRFSEYLRNAELGACVVMLAEISAGDTSGKSEVVAMSMWRLPGSHIKREAFKPPSDHFERQDASAIRMRVFRENIQKAKTEWFDNLYGETQLNLMILATHPRYQRLGAGKALMQWGLQKARREQLPITLFSSPMGKLLYSALGFKEVGIVHTQVEGEEEFVDFPAMLWKPEWSALP